ncbi:UNVERIFIED_CONTAM: hypothetical protein NCL1_52662 [Trichonephila clavipes]
MARRVARHHPLRPHRGSRGQPCPARRPGRAHERQHRPRAGRGRPGGRGRHRPGGAGGDEDGAQHPRARSWHGQGAVLLRRGNGQRRHGAGGTRVVGWITLYRSTIRAPTRIEVDMKGDVHPTHGLNANRRVDHAVSIHHKGTHPHRGGHEKRCPPYARIEREPQGGSRCIDPPSGHQPASRWT